MNYSSITLRMIIILTTLLVLNLPFLEVKSAEFVISIITLFMNLVLIQFIRIVEKGKK